MPPVKRSLERVLYNGLKKLFNSVIEDVRKGADIRDKARAFLESEQVDSYLNNLIGRMVRNVRSDSWRNWREAAIKAGNGPKLYSLIKNEMKGPVGSEVWKLISDNAAYIKTVPQEWAQYITNYTARETLKGKRPEAIEDELRKKMPQHMTKNLKTIARTECAKANAAIVQARAEMCGIRCYFWRCVDDARSRGAHKAMNHILVFYDDPPNPEELFPIPDYIRKDGTPHYPEPYGNYHAGNTFNCRCYQEVVVDVRFLPDTFSYHSGGTIYKTTRAEFLRRFGNIA